MRSRSALRTLLGVVLAMTLVAPPASVWAWGAQAHRLVALIAAQNLSTESRRQVAFLLDNRPLADVATWADQFRDDNSQTAGWHFVNLPNDATAYDRDRDCPRQPRATAGSRSDRWRDCVVDRIEYNRRQLGSASLDRADRAVALKFLVHLVGDLHQPFHAIGVANGGNGIPVLAFGSANCAADPRDTQACNLHGVWDRALVEHRGLDDRAYLELLAPLIARERASPRGGDAASWALESLTLAKEAMLPAQGNADEAYYRAQIAVVDQQLARGGVRLASLLNATLSTRTRRQ